MRTLPTKMMQEVQGGKMSLPSYGAAVTCAAAAVGGVLSIVVFGPSCGAFLYAAWSE